MGVIKRNNDPNYGISEEYIDPAYFFHSYTEDPTFSDLVYAGHIKRISISELKRIAGDELTEEQYEKIAQSVKNKYNNNSDRLTSKMYDRIKTVVFMGMTSILLRLWTLSSYLWMT